MSVQYPEMRERLVALLRGVNDPDAEATWLRDPQSFEDWFNDLDWLASEDLSTSGFVLMDEREAKAVGIFRERINAIFDDLGDASYAAYRTDERWRGVQEPALDAVAVLPG
jgi:hypothetical protein